MTRILCIILCALLLGTLALDTALHALHVAQTATLNRALCDDAPIAECSSAAECKRVIDCE